MRYGIETEVTSSPEIVEKAEIIILPGVGNFTKGMQNLREDGLIPALTKKVLKDKTPILGICLGMQLFSNYSEEGNVPGLGWIDANTIRFNFNGMKKNIRVPHMGWNLIKPTIESPLFGGIKPGQRFYFIHSYHMQCRNKEDVLATANYGYDFVACVQVENIYGVQFHPEKSHRPGMQILLNFIEHFLSLDVK